MPIPLLFIGLGFVASGVMAHQRLQKKDSNTITVKNENTAKKTLLQREKVHQEKTKDINIGFQVASAAALGNGIATLFYPPILLVSLPLTFYSASYVFQDAMEGVLKERKIRSSMVDTVAIIGSIVTGYYFTSTVFDVLYFQGRKLLLKTEDSSKKQLITLFDQYSNESVWLLQEDNIEIETPFQQVKAGQTIVVNAGESILFDGIVIKGLGMVDQHMLTGESQPQDKNIDDKVYASTLLISGKLLIKVEKTGTDTAAARVTEILNMTDDYTLEIESRSVIFADKMAVPTLILSGLAFVSLGTVSAVAITSCNFSDVARATLPLGLLNYIKQAASHNIFIKDGRALELLGKIDTVVFDKTGTLTLEQPEVIKIHTFQGLTEENVLLLAASVEYRQKHPIAKAIQQALLDKDLTPLDLDMAHYEVGYGIKAKIKDQQVLLGSHKYMQMEKIKQPVEIIALQKQAHQQGDSLVYLAIDGKLAGVLVISACLRPEATKITQFLREKGMELYIISGDHEAPTRKLANSLGIKRYFADTLPNDKARLIEKLQAEGRSVCFIGDGINDTIAMKKSQVSISLAGAATAATDTANIVLMDKSLVQLEVLFELSIDFEKNMYRGLGYTFVPGLIGIGGVFLLHFKIAATLVLYVLSSGSSLINATFLGKSISTIKGDATSTINKEV